MKQLIFVFLLYVSTAAQVAQAHTTTIFAAQLASHTTTSHAVRNLLVSHPIIDAITQALNSGDADAIAQYFDAKVEIAIADDEQTYDKAKAKDALKAFFASNKPTGFTSVHSGKSKENSDQYSIGNLATSNGTFRVYIYLKTNGNGLAIKELRFDK
jgi:hypothetical protein